MTALRPATPADAPALAVIHATGFEDGWTADDLAEWLARDGAIAFVSDRNCEAVAFGLALTAGDDAEVLTIAALPDHRRAGHGGRILAAIAAEARQRGLKRMVLEVAGDNLPALGLYRSHGFVEIGLRKNYYRQAAGRVDAIVLARPLGP